ncbi:hypothetical protein GCK32_012129 [Trichostrongylus colubriformis]|uniref:Uncharacterized protein n=1 Tax=Trichostrongylus colubriformis TaxID=6319 RepID=A0AAN8FBF9_TRICO
MQRVNGWRNEYHKEELKLCARLYGRPYLRVITLDPVDYECDRLLVRLDEDASQSGSPKESSKPMKEKEESADDIEAAGAGKTPSIPRPQEKSSVPSSGGTPKRPETPVESKAKEKAKFHESELSRTPASGESPKKGATKIPEERTLLQERTQQVVSEDDTAPSSHADAGVKAEVKRERNKQPQTSTATKGTMPSPKRGTPDSRVKCRTPSKVKTADSKLKAKNTMSKKKKSKEKTANRSAIASKSMAVPNNPELKRSCFYPLKKDTK